MPEYQTYKQEVVDTCHTLLERGYLKATEGNISARIKGQNAFAITPSNYDYAKMQVDDICILDFDMQPIEGDNETVHRKRNACGGISDSRRCALHYPHPPTVRQRTGVDQDADPRIVR